MYIEKVPNRNSPPAILVRECYRKDGKVKKRTLANISKWPVNVIEGLKLLLKGETISSEKEYTIKRSIPHGHVKAILTTFKKLNLDSIISSKPCRERDLVLGMIAERIIHPCSKLATTRLWHSTTLARVFGVENAQVDDLYKAMDWLLERQPRIEKKLAKIHLPNDSMALYDISSSFYEGHTCPLAFYGHSRDQKKGKPIIVYGVMTNERGIPVSVSVYPGNTADPVTVAEQVNKLRTDFELTKVTLVGDRGMLTQTQIVTLKEYPGIGWISALKSSSIKKLFEEDVLQLSLFDKQNLAEITSEEYPSERLVACYNPILARRRSTKRETLLSETEKNLLKIQQQISRRTKKLLKKDEIGVLVGKIINKHKMGKHFHVTIGDSMLQWERNEQSIVKESQLDGIYVVRTNTDKSDMTANDVVRNYKNLSRVERLFRCMKSVDLLVRPIRHHTEEHVRAHIFLCMLSYYVEWYMRKAWESILFEDEELDTNRKVRDAVLPAKESASVKKKKRTKLTQDGYVVHSFETLIVELGTLCSNECSFDTKQKSPSFWKDTLPTKLQEKAFELLSNISTQ